MNKKVQGKSLNPQELPDEIKQKLSKRVNTTEGKIGSKTPEVTKKYKMPETEQNLSEPEEVQEEETVKAEKRLGIEITSGDIDDYLWKGYIEKDIVVIPDKYVVTMRSLTKKDADHIQGLIEKAIEDKVPGVRLNRNPFQTKMLLSTSVRKVNGESIGKDLEKRIEYIENLGEWIYTYLTEKFNLYVLAINEATEFDALKKA